MASGACVDDGEDDATSTSSHRCRDTWLPNCTTSKIDMTTQTRGFYYNVEMTVMLLQICTELNRGARLNVDSVQLPFDLSYDTNILILTPKREHLIKALFPPHLPKCRLKKTHLGQIFDQWQKVSFMMWRHNSKCKITETYFLIFQSRKWQS